jgi:hypothetical protein
MSAELIARVVALSTAAVIVLIAAGPLRSLYQRIEEWTWQRDERTWMAHGLILLTLGFDAMTFGGLLGVFGELPRLLGLISGAFVTGIGVGWYWHKEKMFTGEPMTLDNKMDALTPFLGGLLGIALGLMLQ